MGLEDGELYGTDFMADAGVYRIDRKTGFEKAIARLPLGFSSGLELVRHHRHDDDR